MPIINTKIQDPACQKTIKQGEGNGERETKGEGEEEREWRRGEGEEDHSFESSHQQLNFNELNSSYSLTI